MSLPFSRIITIKRAACGDFVDGFWMENAPAKVFKTSASCQPARQSDLLTMPEGTRISELIRVYTQTPLFTDSEKLQRVADRVCIGDKVFKIVGDMNFQDLLGISSALSHHQYLAQNDNEQTIVDETRV